MLLLCCSHPRTNQKTPYKSINYIIQRTFCIGK
nr:MAG TPA: hypothetical protein [Caudoviricetes sp.]DAO75991.1 MAG TPA: hypothetical protein [Caudoviricetes sp.]